MDVPTMRRRLDVTGDLADTLSASWDAFEFVQVAANAYADRTPELFAGFLFAAAAAAEGRDAVGFAPSMPADPGPPLDQVASRRDVDEIADELAGLAVVLDSRLQAAAMQAGDPEDRAACEHAAERAREIRDLLAPARR